MFTSYSKKMTFVSLLALGVALQAVPTIAMETEPNHLSQKKNILERIDYFYENPEIFQYLIHIDRSPFFLSNQESINKEKDLTLSELKIAAESRNPKAEILLFLTKLNKYYIINFEPAEWPPVHEWLTIQSDSPKALLWLGIFEERFWDGHPSNSEKADQYFLMACEKGSASICKDIAKIYSNKNYSSSGYNINIEKKTEKCYLMAGEKGDAISYKELGDMLFKHSNDIKKLEEYYLMAGRNGDTKAYLKLGKIFEKGYWGQPKDLIKAKNYYLMAAEKKDTKSYHSLATLADKDEEALYWMKKIVQEKGEDWALAALGLGEIYQSSPENADKKRVVYYFTEAIQGFDQKCFVDYIDKRNMIQEALKSYCLPPPRWETPLEFAFVPFTKEDTIQIIENWKTAISCLENIKTRMGWKYDMWDMSCVFKDIAALQDLSESKGLAQEKSSNDVREIEKHTHYEKFITTFRSASSDLQKALEQHSFSFLTPKISVQKHLLKTFKVYDPLDPEDSDEVGICLYAIRDKTVLSFGNEAVKVCNHIMNILEGEYSITSLINHHRKNIALLEKLKTQLNGKFDTESTILTNQILTKPARSIGCQSEVPKPCFSEFLLTTLQKKYSFGREESKEYLAKKIQEIATNVFIELCIRKEMTKHINTKIAKRLKKIEDLKGIATTFKDMLRVTHPQKIARFKNRYDFLSDMFK